LQTHLCKDYARLGNQLEFWHRTLGILDYGTIHVVHYVDPLINIHSLIICDGFEIDILTMKVQGIVAGDLLIIELECKFLDHKLMTNVIGVIYPQYWFRLNCESTFLTHMSLIKWYYNTLTKHFAHGFLNHF